METGFNLKAFFWILLVLLFVIHTEVPALAFNQFYHYSQNYQNVLYAYHFNPSSNPFIYIDKNNGIAISNTGRVFFLETDYSGKTPKITDHYGRPTSLQNDYQLYYPVRKYYKR